MTIKILILSGDYWHPASVLNKGLSTAFESDDYQPHCFEHPGQIPWDRLDAYDVFLLAQWGKIHHDQQGAKNHWMDSALQQTLEAYVQQGGGLFVLHSGLADYDQNGLFRKVVKGHFIHHPQDHPAIEITPAPVDHPILKGVDAFTITDEQYFVDWDQQDTTQLLIGNSEEYGACAAASAHPWGDGRVFSLTPGHKEEVLFHPMMQRLIQNGTRWCAGE